MDESGQKPAVWKHIGLYGHAVGTFTGKSLYSNNNDWLQILMIHMSLLINELMKKKNANSSLHVTHLYNDCGYIHQPTKQE